ncbi:TonB-dependent receptor [Parabacteroides sp. Marseille-P3160]|uniref:SusC/RagA family TonB-linked outer membrane protein n=1 Tax=Parabacteroides sp. Marseille-P3160 TaxID=1917887 RepID=UPI0009BB591E|nr:TonB-dependent receptor [Parabacteroides sp. Marseille-P3160]
MIKIRYLGYVKTDLKDFFRIIKLSTLILFTEMSLVNADNSYSQLLLSTNNSIEIDQQSNKIRITGIVYDQNGDPLIGVNVIEVGTTNGTLTDINGRFSLEINENATLRASYIGYIAQDITVKTRAPLTIKLKENLTQLEEVVVVGYGVQKKESVVASIAQASEEELKRTGNVTNLTEALTGQLPGLVTLTSSGEPGGITTGNSATNMFIRGQNTWNGGQPLILVDGVERNMNNIDVNEVANISILKDASATAVFGVKGANGVVLITTKRGEAGKTKLNFNYTATGTMLSKQPDKLDSYAAMMAKNEIIEREGVLNEPSWNSYVPYEIVQRYRKPQTPEYAVIYPNVDWEKAMYDDMGFSHRATLSAQGGSKNVKYYGMLAYLHEGDMFKNYNNGKGYDPNYNYDRFNFRSNIDFNLTSSTKLSVDLSGFYSQKNTNFNNEGSSSRADQWMWSATYFLAPNLFLPMYDDGYWGAYQEGGNNTVNPLAVIYNLGIRETRTTQLNSNFTLEQDLSFITKGLTVKASLFYDNNIRSEGGIYDITNHVRPGEAVTNVRYKQIYPLLYEGPDQDPSEYTVYLPVSTEEYDWIMRPWTIRAEGINSANWDGTIPVTRRLMYQLQLNYARRFGLHNVSAMGIFKREEYANGNMFKNYREDWVSRLTYDYDSRYLLELNGAYNGSEKFGPGYRFDFFPSLAAGWYISNEKFFRLKWVDRLKLRYSKGWVGDDSGGSRWMYSSQLAYGGSARLNNASNGTSPYTFYRETVIGNPEVRWEKAVKDNFGLEIGLLNNLFSLTADYYTEDRTDILIAGSSRSVPVFFGATPPSANLGRVKSKGFEIELGVNKTLSPGLDIWSKLAITHNENKVMFRDDPPLQYAHLKAAGYPIGQIRSLIANGFYNNWDEVYASIPTETNDLQKLPGYYDLIDFNADGVIKSSEDQAPIGYSEVPQNTAAFTLGVNYKGFSFMTQFYGVNNANRVVAFDNYMNDTDIVFGHVADYWSKDNPNASSFLPRWKTSAENIGNYYVYDASFLRLRIVELSYSFDKNSWIKKLGIENLRIFLNGNNLFFWSDLPDDRETTYSGGSATQGAYPTVKRINLGIDLNF